MRRCRHAHRKSDWRAHGQSLPVHGFTNSCRAGRHRAATESAPATDAPYGTADPRLPTSLGEALEALQADTALRDALGRDFIDYLVRIKQSELTRHDAAEDKLDFQRREYFSRF